MCNEFQWMNEWNCKIARIFILHELWVWGEDKKSDFLMTQLQSLAKQLNLFKVSSSLSTKMYLQFISLTTEEEEGVMIHDDIWLYLNLNKIELANKLKVELSLLIVAS